MITTPVTPDLLRGAPATERTARGLLPHRLPAWARAQNDDPQLASMEVQPSGVRIAVRTAATVIELEAAPTRRVVPMVGSRSDGVFDLVVDGVVTGSVPTAGGDTVTVDLATGGAERTTEPPGVVRFGLPGGREQDVEIWLPHNEVVELVALRTDAPVVPAPAPDRRVWLHHGSSISHGSNAARPTGTWPAVAASLGGVELVNLGFGGSALLDPFVARTMRDTPADLITVKLGINLVNTDLMRRRALGPAVHGFLDLIRDGHPDTPLVLVSAISCPLQEDTPGPLTFDPAAIAAGRLGFVATGDPAEVAAGRLTLSVVRAELAAVVERRDDPHLTYLDGRTLYGPGDLDAHPLPDGLHPDAATHRLIGERFAALVLGPGGPQPRPVVSTIR